MNTYTFILSIYSVAIDIVQKEYERLSFEMKDLSQMLERYQEEYFELISLEDTFIADMSGVNL